MQNLIKSWIKQDALNKIIIEDILNLIGYISVVLLVKLQLKNLAILEVKPIWFLSLPVSWGSLSVTRTGVGVSHQPVLSIRIQSPVVEQGESSQQHTRDT